MGKGGGIYSDSTATLNGTTTITANTSDVGGGGIYNDSGTIDIAPSVSITGNTPTTATAASDPQSHIGFRIVSKTVQLIAVAPRPYPAIWALSPPSRNRCPAACNLHLQHNRRAKKRFSKRVKVDGLFQKAVRLLCCGRAGCVVLGPE
jgi:predicted outer membrane repeat protein